MPLSKEDFVATYGPLADDIAAGTGMDANVVLSVIANESGWGNHYVGNNPFGIKPGGKVAGYTSVGDAGKAFVDLINSKYPKVAAADDQAGAMVAGGYNTTDKDWATKVRSTAAAIKALRAKSATAATGTAPSVDDLVRQTREAVPEPGAAPAAARSGGGGSAAPSVDDLVRETREAVPGAGAGAGGGAAAPQDTIGPDTTFDEYGRPMPTVTSGAAAQRGPRGGIAQNVAAGNLETINAMLSDPVGSMVLHPLAVAGGTAYDALAHATGWYPPMSDAFRRELYGQGATEAALPDHGPINILGDIIGARPSDITTTAPGEGYARAVGGALPAAALIPGSPLLTMPAAAAGAAAGHGLAEMSPEWLKPGAEMAGNILTTGGLLGAAAGIRALDENARPIPSRRPGEPPPTIEGVALPPEDGGGGGAPGEAQPAGAMVTPPKAAVRTAREIGYGNTVADEEWLNAPQQPRIRDTRVLVEGNNPNLAEQEQTVETARELKRLRNEHTEVSQEERELLHDRSENRKTAFNEAVPSDLTLHAEEEAAGKKIESDLKTVWANKSTADTAPVTRQIETELSGSAGHLPPLEEAMKKVSNSLERAGTDPQALYKTHRLLNYLQSKEGVRANPGYGSYDVQAALTRVKGVLAKQIDDSAPGFSQAMKAYSDTIGPIRAAQALNERRSGLFDSRGYMSFNRVHELMDDIIKAGHPDAPTNDLRGISEFQLQRLKDIHDDLKRSASAQDLAKAYGSDTAQNVMDIIKGVGKTAGSMAVRAAAGYVLGPYGPFAVDAAGRMIGARREAAGKATGIARGREILRPQLPPPNPLAGP